LRFASEVALMALSFSFTGWHRPRERREGKFRGRTSFVRFANDDKRRPVFGSAQSRHCALPITANMDFCKYVKQRCLLLQMLTSEVGPRLPS
jgi:hypothetical protein